MEMAESWLKNTMVIKSPTFTEKTISKLENKRKQKLEKIKTGLMNDLLTGKKEGEDRGIVDDEKP